MANSSLRVLELGYMWGACTYNKSSAWLRFEAGFMLLQAWCRLCLSYPTMTIWPDLKLESLNLEPSGLAIELPSYPHLFLSYSWMRHWSRSSSCTNVISLMEPSEHLWSDWLTPVPSATTEMSCWRKAPVQLSLKCPGSSVARIC